MTKEECVALLYRCAEYKGIGIPNLAGCKEAMRMAADLLSQSPLSSNIDEAAVLSANGAVISRQSSIDGRVVYNLNEKCFNHEDLVRQFKAGAEWMAGQLQKIEGDLVDWYSTSDGKDYCCGVKTDEAFEVPEGFYIRKK